MTRVHWLVSILANESEWVALKNSIIGDGLVVDILLVFRFFEVSVGRSVTERIPQTDVKHASLQASR